MNGITMPKRLSPRFNSLMMNIEPTICELIGRNIKTMNTISIVLPYLENRNFRLMIKKIIENKESMVVSVDEEKELNKIEYSGNLSLRLKKFSRSLLPKVRFKEEEKNQSVEFVAPSNKYKKGNIVMIK